MIIFLKLFIPTFLCIGTNILFRDLNVAVINSEEIFDSRAIKIFYVIGFCFYCWFLIENRHLLQFSKFEKKIITLNFLMVVNGAVIGVVKGYDYMTVVGDSLRYCFPLICIGICKAKFNFQELSKARNYVFLFHIFVFVYEFAIYLRNPLSFRYGYNMYLYWLPLMIIAFEGQKKLGVYSFVSLLSSILSLSRLKIVFTIIMVALAFRKNVFRTFSLAILLGILSLTLIEVFLSDFIETAKTSIDKRIEAIYHLRQDGNYSINNIRFDIDSSFQGRIDEIISIYNYTKNIIFGEGCGSVYPMYTKYGLEYRHYVHATPAMLYFRGGLFTLIFSSVTYYFLWNISTKSYPKIIRGCTFVLLFLLFFISSSNFLMFLQILIISKALITYQIDE